PGLSLTFSVYADVELGGKYDLAVLYIEEGSSVVPVWTKAAVKTAAQWTPQTVDLKAYINKTVRLHWFFHVVDGEHNSGKGFFVDNVTLVAPCP
ncbi:MAG: hypothetical protein HUU55_23500, partial [Myxococcales bacterium]|nr:hypothetical protein [Myxococcales bacterium]